VLPPLFCRRSSHVIASFIDHSLANICMSSPPNSLQDSAVNAWKKEISHQMNMFLSDCCLRHLLTPPSMPIQSWMTVQSPRRCNYSKALVIRLVKIYHLFSTILNLKFQLPLKNRRLPKRTSSLLFRLVTKVYMIPLRRSRKSKSFKNLSKKSMIMKICSNDSSMTNTHKPIATPRQLTINYWNIRRSTKDFR